MKTFYGVVSSFFDNGKVTAEIIKHIGTTIPGNTYDEGVTCDTYTDWFASRKEAEQYKHETMSAQKGEYMKRQFFADLYGNTASITKQASGYLLICKNNIGKVWKHNKYQTARGAKSALSRTGEGWHTVRGYVE